MTQLDKQEKDLMQELKDHREMVKKLRKSLNDQNIEFLNQAKKAKVKLQSNEIKHNREQVEKALKKPTSFMKTMFQIDIK